ncbi:MAG: hypothetical protein WDO73_36695 [Ignavibacteriota bacterium]
MTLAALQLLCIWFLLPHDARFLGGLQYVLAAGALISLGAAGMPHWLSAKRVVPGAAGLLMLYVLAAGYYWWPHSAVVFGRESRDVYLSRYVAFYRDFQNLDGSLPRDAVLIPGNRFASVYAPRPVASWFDRPPGSPAFLFLGMATGVSEGQMASAVPGFTEGALARPIVYQNVDAAIECYRKPWPPPLRGQLVVRRLSN